MNHSVYKITRERRRNMTFSFVSINEQEGNPVRKVVSFVPMIHHGQRYFNLEYGDFNYKMRHPDDLVVTDNGDMRKVLKTVASTLEHFFKEFPDRKVRFDGSDQRRHSYYHKLIRDYYRFIVPFYKVQGYTKGKLETFKSGIEYDFIVVTKQ